jgi:Na+/melibiose symporter-like transporter
MSMVPELTVIDNERVALNSARYAFTVLANVAVFVIFFALIKAIGQNADGSTPYKTLFHLLCYISLGVGALTSLFFLFGSEERIKSRSDAMNAAQSEFRRKTLQVQSTPSDVQSDMDFPVSMSDVAAPNKDDASTTLLSADYLINKSTASNNQPEPAVAFTSWRQWFGVREFYQVGVIYMACRLVVNVSQVLIPFYLLDFLKLSDTSITIVPLILYLAQFLSTFGIKALSKSSGRKGALTFGSVFVLIACAAFWFLEPSHSVYVYPTIVSLGIGCAIVMVVSQQLQADLVGNNTTQGAFVYGSHSFADKLSNGIAIFVVQKINGDGMIYVRQAIVFVPAVSMLLALLFTFLLSLESMDGGDDSSNSKSKSSSSSH